FGSALQERVLARFHYAVRDGGYLFLGRSESLLARSRMFAPLHLKWRLFQRISPSHRGVSAIVPDEGLVTAGEARADATGSGLSVQRALEALPSAIMVIDATDTILTWNPAAEALFETPAANAVGRKFREIDVSYRVEGLRARMEDVKARQASTRMSDITFTRRSGDVVHAEIMIGPLFDGYRFIGLLVAVDDASET